MTPKSKRVLVTGGSGFIGTHLCAGLRTRGWEPVVLDPVAPNGGDCEFHQGDMSTLIGPKAFLLEDVGAVIHLAWTTKPGSATDAPLHDVETNLAAGIRMLDIIVKLPRPPRVIFASSGGAVYGATASALIDEDHPAAPLSAYGVGKLAFENYLRLYRHLHGLDYLVFRPSNPYGEFQNPLGSQGAVAVFLGKIALGHDIAVWGDGSVVRDYVYVGDLVGAFERALEYCPGGDEPRVFNVGSGLGMNIRELVAALSEIAARPARIVYSPGRMTDAPRVVLNIDRIRRHLGWQPSTSIDVGLRRTWEWVRARVQ